jgi:hypothetical protein
MKSKVIHTLLALSIGTAAFVASAQPESKPGAASTVKRWECAALTHDGAEVLGDEKLSAKIIEMGNEGWELVSVSTIVKNGTTTKTIFYFKRPKQ